MVIATFVFVIAVLTGLGTVAIDTWMSKVMVGRKRRPPVVSFGVVGILVVLMSLADLGWWPTWVVCLAALVGADVLCSAAGRLQRWDPDAQSWRRVR